jgi:hypothetical protein
MMMVTTTTTTTMVRQLKLARGSPRNSRRQRSPLFFAPFYYVLIYVCLYTFSLSEGLLKVVLSYWKTNNDGDFCPFFEAFFSLTKRARNHRKERRIFVSLSSDKNRLSNLFSLVFLLKGGCLRIIKAFQKCAQKVCSLFFLSFSVV